MLNLETIKMQYLKHTLKSVAALQSNRESSVVLLFTLNIWQCKLFAAPSTISFLFNASPLFPLRRLCMVKCILLQSQQQNHISFGDFCSDSRKTNKKVMPT